MRSAIVSAINQNLNQASLLLDVITNQQYTDESVGPYYSSVGSHLRHTLDFFNCVIDGLDNNQIDLTARKREEEVATNKNAAKKHIARIQETLVSFLDVNTDYLIHVTDNLGQGNVTVNYTLDSIMAHANSHAVHHFATIGYVLHKLNVMHNISGFGYNPTTPIQHRKGI
ncbi:DinB family protein [Aquimarina agarilytica]|uniref:DinB family protein n=1 Tax=Aquimarina agarilytica TaxID=1087449 RepID=UPI000289D6F9|nr:DinB family protein [Aquimarina agarilytica]